MTIEHHMSLPPSLGVTLKKFQGMSHTAQRVAADRPSYGSATSITFPLPRSGVIDLQSLAVLATINITSAATTSIKTLPLHSGMFRRVSFQMGSANVISLQQLSDYGFAHLLTRVYQTPKPRTDYLQTIGKEGNVTLTTATDANIVLASDFLGFLSGKHCRYLPMDVLPDCYITIDLKDSQSWAICTGGTTTITAASLTNVRLLFNRIDWEGNLYSQLWADRLLKAPIQIPFDDVRYLEGPTTASAGSATYTGFVSGQSIDFLLATYRPSGYGSGLTADVYKANNGGDASTLNQLFWNGAPLSSFAMNVEDSLWATSAALDGAGNMIYSPDFTLDGAVTATGNEFRDNFFALIYRMRLSTEAMDGPGWCTGVNTYGNSVPVDLVISAGTSTSRKPVILAYCTGICEVSAGKQVVPIN